MYEKIPYKLKKKRNEKKIKYSSYSQEKKKNKNMEYFYCMDTFCCNVQKSYSVITYKVEWELDCK